VVHRVRTDGPAIVADRVAKDFVLVRSFGDFIRLCGSAKVPSHRALDGISLALNKGEVLGLIGYNGAGKSTLLRILSEVSLPTTGQLAIRGRKLVVLEMSTGFNPFLTGRENIWRRLTLYGISRDEIAALEPGIVAFAELEAAIDQPLITYSTGMRARLAFAVVTSPRSDVLLLDELLAVGDEYFQGKCVRRIAEACEGGTTAVIASHDIGMIQRLCNRAVWLEHGRVRMAGSPFDVGVAYYGADARAYDASLARSHARIDNIQIERKGDRLAIQIDCQRLEKGDDLFLQVAIYDGRIGTLVLLHNTGYDDVRLPAEPGAMNVSLVTACPPRLTRGLVSAVLFRGSAIPSAATVEDAWGWDNDRSVRFEFGEPTSAGPYIEYPLLWTRVT
jgi:ABC-type polysaccharide/polyol phosphate transport system ATPase subunit